jgi:phosphate transport system permease protein
VLSSDGIVRVVDLQSGRILRETPVPVAGPHAAAIAAVSSRPDRQLLIAAFDDGRIVALPVAWQSAAAGGRRTADAEIGGPAVFEPDVDRRPPAAFTATIDSTGVGTAAVRPVEGGHVSIVRTAAPSPDGGRRIEKGREAKTRAPDGLSVLLLDADAKNLYGGTERGDLVFWRIEDGRPVAPQTLDAGGSPITSLALLRGDRSLVVGRGDGSLSVWFAIPRADGTPGLTRVRDFPPHPGAIRLVAPSPNGRAFLARDDSDRLGLYHSTSHRTLWRGPSPVADAAALAYAPGGGAAIVAGGSRLGLLHVRDPHPEVGLRALLGRVWYEGRPRPEHDWHPRQDPGGREPVFGLTPLVFGTLKGACFALLLAIPLGVLGAVYASQFVHPDLQRFIRPTVEFMAATPTVVLGFVAGVWLAPRLERVLPGVVLAVVTAPVVLILASYGWRALPARVRKRVPPGWETLPLMTVLAVVVAASMWAGPWFEAVAFGGDSEAWLLEVTGLRYAEHNALLVGLAMGFAVIPIIFSIVEDALSNVPRGLIAGSLALGADRWQTVRRVVLPTASPAIVSAILIGLGRAVGETMIVLMAAGNVPLMEWNPFTGFRSLAASIAMDAQGAAQGSSPLRTLFLAALLLFLFTFAVNTAGYVVRQRLRRRYADL